MLLQPKLRVSGLLKLASGTGSGQFQLEYKGLVIRSANAGLSKVDGTGAGDLSTGTCLTGCQLTYD